MSVPNLAELRERFTHYMLNNDPDSALLVKLARCAKCKSVPMIVGGAQSSSIGPDKLAKWGFPEVRRAQLGTGRYDKSVSGFVCTVCSNDAAPPAEPFVDGKSSTPAAVDASPAPANPSTSPAADTSAPANPSAPPAGDASVDPLARPSRLTVVELAVADRRGRFDDLRTSIANRLDGNDLTVGNNIRAIDERLDNLDHGFASLSTTAASLAAALDLLEPRVATLEGSLSDLASRFEADEQADLVRFRADDDRADQLAARVAALEGKASSTGSSS